MKSKPVTVCLEETDRYGEGREGARAQSGGRGVSSISPQPFHGMWGGSFPSLSPPSLLHRPGLGP